ncbi:MAG: PAS domain S-box protein [Desulfobacterales bacterium]|nr:PAS domain S-box protein [Desulfobacterales bacterium]
MRIFHKILAITLPMALISLFTGAWLTYTLSEQAIRSMADRWLGTRLEEAMDLVQKHEAFLRLYGITNIKAGTQKAQYDALRELKAIRIGEAGYIFVLDTAGRLVYHPHLPRAEADAQAPPPTFMELPQLITPGTGAVTYKWQGNKHLAMSGFFTPWNWVVVATDPLNEIYGSMNHAKRYLFILALLSSGGISLLIILLTRRLVAPLQLLADGARKVGKGDLDVNIPVRSSDEIGRLSTAFNTMSRDLKQSLSALRRSEKHFRAVTENSSDLIAVLDGAGRIRYTSPSVTRLLGYKAENLKDQPFSHLMDDPSNREFDHFIFRVARARSDEVAYQEFVFLNRQGQARIFEISARNLIDKPKVGGIVVNSRDMTTRKKIETELKTSELQLHRLSAKLISAQEDERKRLSVELHDEVGQSLTVMKLKVILMEEGLDPEDSQGRKECEDMVAYIDQVIENVRRLCRDLAPPAIEDLGLPAALMWLMDTLKQHYTLTVDMDIEGVDQRLDLDNQILVYRIFQEALNNAVKHAKATELSLQGIIMEDRLFFSIMDNGQGFNLDDIQANRPENKGLGLPSMRERARMLGGNFVLKSQPGQGTILQFSLPLGKKEGHDDLSHHIGR